MAYWYVLIACIILYGLGCFLLSRRCKKSLWVDVAFTAIIFGAYLYCVLAIYFKVGAKDWCFTNALPTANVSPFTFTLTPIMLVLPPRIRKYFFLLIAFSDWPSTAITTSTTCE